MIKRPHVGQVVRLNDEGMNTIGGLKTAEMVKQAQRMVITYSDSKSLTDDVDTFSIHVDQPLINRFLLTNHDVDPLEE